MSESFDILGLSEAAAFKLRLLLAGAVAMVLAGLVLWYGEWRADAVRAQVTARYEQAISEQKAAASTRLSEETRKVLEAERLLREAQGQIEDMGHEREAIARSYEDRLAALAAAGGGRLRDPHAAAGCGGGGGGAPGETAAAADAGAADRDAPGGLLSGPLTGLLRRVVREAQEQADAYAACRADAMNIRGMSPSPTP